MVADRALFLPATPEDAARITRARRVPGDAPLVEVSGRRGSCPGGTAVAVRVPEQALSPAGVPGRFLVDRAVITPDRVGRALQPWHVDVEPDPAQRWKAYLHPDMPLVLRNLVGADLPATLSDREDEAVAAGLVELTYRPVEPAFDLGHLRAVHARLFGEVYPWAGETRTVDITRRGGPSFCPWEQVEDEFAVIAGHLGRRGRLAGPGREEFTAWLTRVYDAVNRVHPFREGNGRTQRVWVSDLARAAGYRVDWERVHGAENDRACQLARGGDMVALHQMMERVVHPLSPGEAELERAVQFAEQLRRSRAPLSGIGRVVTAPPPPAPSVVPGYGHGHGRDPGYGR